MFLISGITGHVGGAAARQLLEEGKSVRALVRDPQKANEWAQKGVEIHQGDFTDAASVAKALQGVEGAFLMIPPILVPSPGFPEARAVIASYQKALAQTPPPRLVLLSSIGSEQSSGLGNITTTHIMEEALADSPFPTAIVRAGSFLENYIPALKTAKATGIFHSLWTPTDRPIPMIASADIGAQVAHLLVRGWSGKKIVELGSPISPDDLAHAMSETLARPVQAQEVPRDQWTPSLEAQGFPSGATALYEEMVESFNSNWIHFGVEGTEPVAATLTPAQVFAQAKTQ